MKSLLIGLLIAFAAAGQPVSRSTAAVQPIVRSMASVSYPAPGGGLLDATLLTFCTADASIVDLKVTVNFPQASARPHVAPFMTPIPGQWAACFTAVVANPIWAVMSVTVAPIREDVPRTYHDASTN